MRGKSQGFDLTKDIHKSQIFGRDQDGRYQASSYGKLRVSNIIKCKIWNIGSSVFQSKEQNREKHHQECFDNYKVSIETLIEEMKSLVMGDKRG